MNWHEIDNRVREELEGLQANPPVEAWLAISDAINPEKRKKTASAVIKIAAAVSFLVISSLSALYFLSNEATQSANLVEDRVTWFMEPIFDLTPFEYKTPTVSVSKNNIIPLSYYQLDSNNQDDAPMLLLPAGEVKPLPSIDRPGLFIDEQLISFLEYDHVPVQNLSGEPVDNFFSRLLSQNALPSSKISVGAHFTPRSSYRMLKQNNSYYMQSIPFQALEEQIMTYGMGVFVNYKIAGNWSIESGISMINMGQYIKDIFSYTHPVNIPLFESITKSGQVIHPQSVITSQGNILFSDLYHYYSDVQSFRVLSDRKSIENSGLKSLRKSNEGLTQVFSYIELPLALRYELFRSTFGVQVKAGAAGHYLMQNDVFLGTDITQNPVGETYGISRFNLSAFGGLSLDLPLTNKITFHLEPTAQIFLRPVGSRSMFYGQAHPYSFMLQSGVSYGL